MSFVLYEYRLLCVLTHSAKGHNQYLRTIFFYNLFWEGKKVENPIWNEYRRIKKKKNLKSYVKYAYNTFHTTNFRQNVVKVITVCVTARNNIATDV